MAAVPQVFISSSATIPVGYKQPSVVLFILCDNLVGQRFKCYMDTTRRVEIGATSQNQTAA
jgi:hypothetical protein